MKTSVYKATMAIILVLALSFTVESRGRVKDVSNRVKASTEQLVAQNTSQMAMIENSLMHEFSAVANNSSASEIPQGTKTMYVSVNTGSNRNDGSQGSPIKDLQKAIDLAPEGAVLLVAEGNYLGTLDRGWIKVDKYMSIIGGFNDDFSQRNPLKYRTTMRPGAAQIPTSGNQGVLDIRVSGKPDGVVIIDGIILDRGQISMYVIPAYDKPEASAPAGTETGRIVVVGESPGMAIVQPQGMTSAFQLIHGEAQGKITIRNCVLLNGYHFGIQMANKGGHFDIYNNVFVANRMSACEIRSGVAKPNTATVAFHNNTVLFTWCRTKHMEDMGYGVRYMTGVDTDVYDNIIGCSNYGALDRTYIDSDKNKEVLRKTSAWNNLFFGNRNGDLVLPSGGGGWTFVLAKDFEDVDQLIKYKDNREMNEAEAKALSKKIDVPYLKGFIGITGTQTSTLNPNSSLNTFRSALGMNMQGTETTRVSMYGNRYPFEKAFELFGAIEGYGAQNIK